MPAPKREYSRLYLDLVDDPMFADVYPDDATFGTWAKLLMLADVSWPSSAPLPAGCSKGRLKRLQDAGLIVVTGIRFRVRGMDKERGVRSAAGKAGAKGRWGTDPGPDDDDAPPMGNAIASDGPMPPHPGGNATSMRPHPGGNATSMRPHPNRNADGMPSKDEQSKAEQSRAETSKARALDGSDPFGDLMALFSELTGLAHAPIRGTRFGDKLLRWVEKDGWAKVEATARETAEDLGSFPEFGQLVNSMDNRLHPPLGAAAVAPKSKAERFEDDVDHLKRRAALKLAEGEK